jgi:hypothetical protein
MTTIRCNSPNGICGDAARVHNKYLEIGHAMVCRLFGCPVDGSRLCPFEGARRRQRTLIRVRKLSPGNRVVAIFEIICCDREESIRTFAAATPDLFNEWMV